MRASRAGTEPQRGPERHEAHISTEQSAAQEDARLPRADADQERAPRPQASSGQGPETTHRVSGDARFRAQDRIRKRSEYQVVYDKGQRIPSGSFVLFVMRNGVERPRLGITVTRRIGGAVRRNRAKRLIREIFRRHKSELADVDIVVNGRPGLPNAEYGRLEEEFLSRLRAFRKRP
jgi:ribonuclease P protein component